MSQLSSKDKRYAQQVEKHLALFDTLEEWADHIAFLSKLQKTLQLSEDTKSAHTVSWIPYSSGVANKLALCLSSRLPNGVHQKTLSIYEAIFNSLTKETFNKEIGIWLPGLLPLLSYCSIQVKPQLIKLYNYYLLRMVTVPTLRLITKPLILTFLAGIEDENSESFSDIFDLLDLLKKKLEDDAYFWQNIFISIIANPERRLGALHWCNKRLPSFAAITVDGKSTLSDEADACIGPESGLLIRAFVTAINSVTTFNSANDIIVIRGFFDLLIGHLLLDSVVINKMISIKDKELLLMACCKVTLKKDMSLNRRLWNWLLGPESDIQSSDTHNKTSRSAFFSDYALETITLGIMKMIKESVSSARDAFKISLALILDKWEISHQITPKLFLPILTTCYENKDDAELLKLSQSLFDAIESSYIWNDIILLIKCNDESKHNLLLFTLRTFNCNVEEMVNLHVPTALLILLINQEIDHKWLDIFGLLVGLIHQDEFFSSNTIPSLDQLNSYTDDKILGAVDSFYEDIDNNSTNAPIPLDLISYLIIRRLNELVINNLDNFSYASKLVSTYLALFYSLPEGEVKSNIEASLIKRLLDQPISSSTSTEVELQDNLLTSLNLSKIFGIVYKCMSPIQKSIVFKIILSNVWFALKSPYPSNYQVEVVKLIFDLEITTSNYEIEAGILKLLANSSDFERVRALSCLWVHSSIYNENDSIIIRPLQLVLDDLNDKDSQKYLCANDFIKHVLKSSSINRLFKLITNPLLSFDFMMAEVNEFTVQDDLDRYAYYLNTIVNVLGTNPKILKDSLNHELVVMDNNSKLNIIKSNNWDISTYKSLIFSIIRKTLKLKLSAELQADSSGLASYYNVITSTLQLFSVLVTGNEADFIDFFNLLLDTCSYHFELSDISAFDIELVQIKYITCILQVFKIAEELNVNLELLHIENEEKIPHFVKFLTSGITNAKSSILLENFLLLLTKSLYLFNDTLFSVILLLNDTLVKKIGDYFESIKENKGFIAISDVEASMNILIGGLEDLLSIGHSYLITSKFRSQNDKLNNASDSGFFGNVIQGVFQIESPHLRTTEDNKRYSILLSFQDAVKACYMIWTWADSRPQIYNDYMVAEKSLSHLATKLKFRTRKFMEGLIDLERQEVIEKIIEVTYSATSSVKLLNVLDGGRSQVTLPYIFNSLISRCYPQMLDESKLSSFNVPISAKEIAEFLVLYFKTIDNDTISDIWLSVTGILRDIIAHGNNFKSVMPNMLQVVKILSSKLNASKFGEQKKNKKDISEIAFKMLYITISHKPLLLIAKETNEEEKYQQSEISTNLEDEIINSLHDVLEGIEYILQDQDKISNIVNLIIANIITPQVKSKSVHEVPVHIIGLIESIGKFHPNKSWRTLIYDIFMDNSFFNMTPDKLLLWRSIFLFWVEAEDDKMGELISKITPLVSSSPSNIFIWNENSEVENKIFILKRISYLIIIQRKDYFLNNIDALFNRIEYSMNNACPFAYKSEIFYLLRVITFKFSEMHLLPYWTAISHELIKLFELILEMPNNELDSFTNEELDLILNGCKLLDQLLLLDYDEFNLNEWLFTSSNTSLGNTASNLSLSIIDKISKEVNLTNPRDDPVKIDRPDADLKPLLYEVTKISSVKSLRLFFDSLSFISYERTYGLYKVKDEVFEHDLLHDLTM